MTAIDGERMLADLEELSAIGRCGRGVHRPALHAGRRARPRVARRRSCATRASSRRSTASATCSGAARRPRGARRLARGLRAPRRAAGRRARRRRRARGRADAGRRRRRRVVRRRGGHLHRDARQPGVLRRARGGGARRAGDARTGGASARRSRRPAGRGRPLAAGRPRAPRRVRGAAHRAGPGARGGAGAPRRGDRDRRHPPPAGDLPRPGRPRGDDADRTCAGTRARPRCATASRSSTRSPRTAGRDTVCNVGAVRFEPGAGNIVPALAELLVEYRDLVGRAARRARRGRRRPRGADADLERRRDDRAVIHQDGVAMDEGVIAALERGAEVAGSPARRMPSGAGHDAHDPRAPRARRDAVRAVDRRAQPLRGGGHRAGRPRARRARRSDERDRRAARS